MLKEELGLVEARRKIVDFIKRDPEHLGSE